MLGLDDRRWGELRQAYGAAGGIPALLRSLGELDGRDAVWHDLWSALCHQGTVYSASFAAVPHVVALGATVPEDEQLDFWLFVGAVAGADDAMTPPEDLRPAYEAAVVEAERHALVWLREGVHQDSAAWMLVAVAGLRGLTAIANVLEGLRTDPVLTAGAKRTRVTPRSPRAALEDLAALVERSGLGELAAKVRALDGDVVCPHCARGFPILEEDVR